MAEDPEPATCLSNLAGLLILNEFDNFVGYVFEQKVHRKYPKLQIVDEILKDEFKIHSQHTAAAFSNFFVFINFTTGVLSLQLWKDVCQNFDQYWDDIDEHTLDIRAFSTRTKVLFTIMSGIFFIYMVSCIFFPFITIPLLNKYYLRKEI